MSDANREAWDKIYGRDGEVPPVWTGSQISREAWDKIYGRDMAPPLTLDAGAFLPADDRVVITPLPVEEKTRGGLHLPPSARGIEVKYRTGIVEFVGPGRVLASGERLPCTSVRGQTVMYREYDATEIMIESVLFVMVQESTGGLVGFVSGGIGEI